MNGKTLSFGSVSDSLCKFYSRAKYVPDREGKLRLASIQYMTRPVYGESGFEEVRPDTQTSGGIAAHAKDANASERSEVDAFASYMRSARRAKIGAFDAILCNHDLDTFATITYAPDSVKDRCSYDDCYNILRPWLSNRVQRRGLKYILCPERHKSGGIHMHMICNSEALQIIRARNAHTGRVMSHNGNPLYNLSDWTAGFSSAEIIRDGDGDREAVAKYIFKYMGKQMGQKIGGRYFLHGGDLVGPSYLFANDPKELGDLSTAKHYKIVDNIGDTGLCFQEWSFI